MSQRIKAVFHDGAFVPKQPCSLPEGSEVELTVEGPLSIPEGTDPEERQRIMKALIERMRQNPIPSDAPQFIRGELHERR